MTRNDLGSHRFKIFRTIGLGALLMYVFDPQQGRRRRARLRDKMIHYNRKARSGIDATARDIRNRTAGVAIATRKMFSGKDAVGTELVQRVRATVRGVVSHPNAITVHAEAGKVTLSGPILEAEVTPLIEDVGSVPGVSAVENRLEVHREPGNVPGLQGAPAVRKSGQVPDIMQANWSPTTRFIAGTFGGTLALIGAKQLSALGTAVAAVGTAILTRALTNMDFKRLTGIGAGRGAVALHKIINVAAPVEQVFAFWSDYRNFPRFMSNVRDVRETGEKQSHWTVAGPAGAPVEWNATVTDYVPNRSIGWKTMPDSPVQHEGIVRFESNADGSTRVDIRFSYNPVAGGLGHAVAAMLGADPKTQMDEDLARMKILIETGRPPHDAARTDDSASIH